MADARPELRQLRQAKGLTIKEMAHALNMSPENLGRIEAGKHKPQGENFRNLADFLGISYQRLTDILNGNQGPGDYDQDAQQLGPPKKFSLFVALEAQAKKLQVYAPRLIDGLCQTEPYMRVLIENERGLGPTTEQRIGLRLNRQKALTRKSDPLQYYAILHEAALCVEIGDNRTMREQFEHLEWLMQLPNVELRVLPFSAGSCHLDNGGFTLITLPYDDEPGMAYQEMYDGPSHKELGSSEHYASILMAAFNALYSMTLDRDGTLAVFDRMKRKYPR
jgi:transcriptional regulator with XRE-family HTH domain